MRGVTALTLGRDFGVVISTHTPHARRDHIGWTRTPGNGISTHTPHARRDRYAETFPERYNNFYSHASCEA